MGMYNNPLCPELLFSVLFRGVKEKASSFPFAVVSLSIFKMLSEGVVPRSNQILHLYVL